MHTHAHTHTKAIRPRPLQAHTNLGTIKPSTSSVGPEATKSTSGTPNTFPEGAGVLLERAICTSKDGIGAKAKAQITSKQERCWEAGT